MLRTDEPLLCRSGPSVSRTNSSNVAVATEELVPFGQIFGHQSLSISCTKLGRVNDQDLKKSLALSTLSPKFVMHASMAVPTLYLSWCP